MTTIIIQLLFVLIVIIVGAMLGGIGLDVILMIVAVISAAASMQAAGGLNFMVKIAERILRKHPSSVTILSPLSISVIASQQAISASPISAATVALLGMLASFNISLLNILMITIPATLIGVLLAALFCMHNGKELNEDPEYHKRLKAGLVGNDTFKTEDFQNPRNVKIPLAVFLLATILNHSFMLPGLISTVVAICVGLLMIQVLV